MESFGKFSALILILFAALFLKAFVFMKLFGWFIVPAFNIHPITLAQSVGIVIISLLLSQSESEKKKSEDFFEKLMMSIASILVLNAITLGLGWMIYKLFM